MKRSIDRLEPAPDIVNTVQAWLLSEGIRARMQLGVLNASFSALRAQRLLLLLRNARRWVD